MIAKCKTVCRLFRVGEWYDSEIPLLILPALYILILTNGIWSGQQLCAVVMLTVFDCLFLAFGYLINDYSDLEVDRLAGKKKVMHAIPRQAAFLMVVLSAAAGCLSVLVISHSGFTVLCLALIYFFGAFYSARPLRFKERGIWGWLVSSTAQHCFPLFLIPLLMGVSADLFFWLWVLLGFFIGVRYILVHQYIDAENDRKTGVITFALRHQKRAVVLIRVSFAAELVLSAVLMSEICRRYHWTVLFIPVYLLLFTVRWRGSCAVFGHGGLYSFDQMPLEDFYNNYLPLLFAVILCCRDVRWGIFLAAWAVFLAVPTVRRLRFPARIVSDRIKMRRKRIRNEG
ncbi:MAG: UbiA family prenyltransferase [Clostridiales bacterium]|nr:UbiA family prenyltransferase [Clostridiales bacterium]